MKEEKAEAQIQTVAVVAQGVFQTAKVDISNLGNLDLNMFESTNIDLEIGYWSPEVEGETMRVIFDKIVEDDTIPDFNDPKKLVEKPCAYFLTQIEVAGLRTFKIVRCGASRLVSAFTAFGGSAKDKVYDITFRGKKKNKSNNFLSSVFSIQPVRTS